MLAATILTVHLAIIAFNVFGLVAVDDFDRVGGGQIPSGVA